MAFQRRIYLVFLGFLGLLVSIGFRSVFSMVMVHVVKSKHAEEEGLFGKVGVIPVRLATVQAISDIYQIIHESLCFNDRFLKRKTVR